MFTVESGGGDGVAAGFCNEYANLFLATYNVNNVSVISICGSNNQTG